MECSFKAETDDVGSSVQTQKINRNPLFYLKLIVISQSSNVHLTSNKQQSTLGWQPTLFFGYSELHFVMHWKDMLLSLNKSYILLQSFMLLTPLSWTNGMRIRLRSLVTLNTWRNSVISQIYKWY